MYVNVDDDDDVVDVMVVDDDVEADVDVVVGIIKLGPPACK